MITGIGIVVTEDERASATADGEERIARTELIRAPQRNEGALGELFQGNRRRVGSDQRPPASAARPTRAEERRRRIRAAPRDRALGRQGEPFPSCLRASGVERPAPPSAAAVCPARRCCSPAPTESDSSRSAAHAMCRCSTAAPSTESRGARSETADRAAACVTRGSIGGACYDSRRGSRSAPTGSADRARARRGRGARDLCAADA